VFVNYLRSLLFIMKKENMTKTSTPGITCLKQFIG